ncbi:MAG: hypothetical protein JW834_03045 [Candidatus Diapherotrites archaeon]|nr:hypothetical protein [Candidatus Diapherotrites archaeon]
MEEHVKKYSLILAYGFLSMFLIALSFYLTCLVTGCKYYLASGVCICPLHLTLPLAFVSFMTAAITPLFSGRADMEKSLVYGLAAVIALFFAVTVVTMTQPSCCPLLEIADVGIYCAFFTSVGSAYMNWPKEKKTNKRAKKK